LFKKILTLTKQSLIYGIGYVLSRFLAFLLLPFYSHYMPPEEYGALVLVYMFIAVMQIIYVGGLDIAFLRYYVAEASEIKKRIFSNAFFAMGGIGFFISLIFFCFPFLITTILFASPPAGSALWVKISCGILFLDTLSNTPLLRLRGEHKPTHFAVVKFLNVAINIGANIVLVGIYRQGLNGALYANLISAGITVVMLLPVIASIISIDFKWSTLKELWRFGLPNVPAMFFLYIIEFSDRKIIELTRGLEEAGLYSAGYKMGMFMAIVTSAFRFAWQPFFLTEAKNEGAEKTFARVFTYFFAVAGFMFMVFVMFAGDFVMMKLPLVNITILEQSYWAGMAVFPIVLLAHFVDGLFANFTVGIYLKKKTKLIPLCNGAGALFNLVANLFIIPRYGMIGAAWTTLGAFILMTAMLYFLIQRHYYIPYEWSRVLKLFFVGGVIMAIYYYYPGGIWWRFLLLLSLPLWLYLIRFFDQAEIKRIKSVLKFAS
jgi:O-antigen/teichoic acid export membrane protein